MSKKEEIGNVLKPCDGTFIGAIRYIGIFIINGKMFEISNEGMCYWYKVFFSWVGTKKGCKNFYVLRRSPYDLEGKREELINDVLCREYDGKQNCFVEMVQRLLWLYIHENKQLNRKLVLDICVELELDSKTAILYTELFLEIFEIE